MSRPQTERTSVTLEESLSDWAPSPLELVRAVLGRSSSRFSELHGEGHWLAVAHAGLTVGKATLGADLRVVFLFGLLHDSMRVNEYDDPEHGGRSAVLIPDLESDGVLEMPEDERRLLVHACRLHSDGLTSADPTVGTCWDADRLNLWRLGWTPAVTLLSTVDARSMERIEWAREALRDVPSWPDLLSITC